MGTAGRRLHRPHPQAHGRQSGEHGAHHCPSRRRNWPRCWRAWPPTKRPARITYSGGSASMAVVGQPATAGGSFQPQALLTGVIPQEWYTARVAEVYKKGTMADPNNYRPISLLSTSCKLFARILQKRLEAAIDSKLRSTQYGFRATRSTSQAIHVARRLVESAERRGSTLCIQLLDWTQAFHKVHPQAVSQALSRHGVTPEFIRVVEAIYQSHLHSQGCRKDKPALTGQLRDSAGMSVVPVSVSGGAQHDHGRCRRGLAAERKNAALASQPEPGVLRLGLC